MMIDLRVTLLFGGVALLLFPGPAALFWGLAALLGLVSVEASAAVAFPVLVAIFFWIVVLSCSRRIRNSWSIACLPIILAIVGTLWGMAVQRIALAELSPDAYVINRGYVAQFIRHLEAKRSNPMLPH